MNRFAKETFIFIANLTTFFDIAIKKDTFSTNILKKCGNRLKKHAKDLNAAKDSMNYKAIKVFKDFKDLNWIQRVYFSKAIRWGKQASRRKDDGVNRRAGERARGREGWRNLAGEFHACKITNALFNII